jgi:NADPH:quinone reductase-like Zn-dependent oxidoreductase
MRAVVFTRRGGPDVLRVQEVDPPETGSDEVLIDVHAAGINFSDVLSRVGLYPNAPKPPAVLGYEVAGVVNRDPHGRFESGQRVLAFVRHGGYAEQAAARANDVLALPDGMSFEQGAAIPLTYAMAYAALVRYGACLPGEKVLIHGAAGGVGTAATKLAKRLELEVWGTATASKHEAIQGFGVDHPIDYRADGWEDTLPPMDLVMDAIGGKSFRQSYRLLGAGGRLVCYGASSVLKGEKRNLVTAARALVRSPRFNPMKQMGESKSVLGVDTIRIWEEKGDLGELLQPLAQYLNDRNMAPAVDRSFPFEKAPDAHRMLGEHRNVGKVLLTPS